MGKVSMAFVLIIIIGAIVAIKTISFSGNPGMTIADSSAVPLSELMGEEHVWTAPDISTIPANAEGKLISYGRELVIHTSKYYGPKGIISKETNGLNCQNCHLDAGTRPYGNNLGSTFTTYPKYLPRAGHVVTVYEKVNECFLRSMNGSPIDTNSKEMSAFVAYIKWLGKDFNKGEKLAGSGGIKAPHFIDRAADPDKGKIVFEKLCARCHGSNGDGQFTADVLKDETKQQGGTATAEDLYYYPPVWGEHSFNGIATLYRMGKLAGFVKNNMPYPVNYNSSVLTDEQAWDVAAYINSRQRPVGDHSKDYLADISKKPYDFPFPPYADNLSEDQHKFGPYKGMASAQKAH